jgi:periplasmic divalent cation tolerance protein
MSRYVACLTTFGSPRDAEKAARRLVRKKLVACANLLPGVVSFFFWKSRFCRDREVLLIMKTTSSKIPSLEKELHQIHPYELPELIVLPIVGGSRRYLNWLAGGVRG